MTVMVCQKCPTGFARSDWYHAHMHRVHGVETGDYEFIALRSSAQSDARRSAEKQPRARRTHCLIPTLVNVIKRRFSFW
ncbi:hypothetical protein H4R19_000455 [Coemansia spiralis]|nr:hypothetical protein H4R19_000455 [Coemansia spiralis]